eukprot:COSAG03_NODE_2563_length_2639_cov_23.543701_1_plen_78_part_00
MLWHENFRLSANVLQLPEGDYNLHALKATGKMRLRQSANCQSEKVWRNKWDILTCSPQDSMCHTFEKKGSSFMYQCR